MVKKSIFTLMFLSVIGWVSAQSLQFEWNGHVYSDGETIECTNDAYGYGEYIQDMQLRNLTSSDLNVIVEKEIVESLDGTMDMLCWGLCFGPETFISPNPVMISANSLNPEMTPLSFHVIFDEGVYGKVRMRYYAYDESNPLERVSINVTFTRSSDGVNENAVLRFGQAYPNPASSVVNFDYNINLGGKATVSIYNLLGQELLIQQLDGMEGQASLSVADLTDGIYFCNLMVDGRAVKTEKFVVKKY